MKKMNYATSLILLIGAMLGGTQFNSAQVQASSDSSAIAETKLVSPAPLSSSRNIYMSGPNIRSTGDVEGDFMAMGGKVTVEHPIKGDAALVAGSVNVRAPIGDDLRVAGGDIVIDSLVGGELFAAGGTITISKTARISNTTNLIGGEIVIDGIVDGPLKVRAKKIILNGEINNNARLAGENIELGPMAKITGAFNYVSRNPLNKAQGAVINGLVKHEEGDPFAHENENENGWQRHAFPMRGSTLMRGIFVFIAMFACATVFQLLFPDFSKRASGRISTSPWHALASGFGTIFGVPLLMLSLFITILGIPLAILLLGLFPVLILAGYFVGIFLISQRLQIAAKKELSTSFASNMAFFGLALLLIMLLGYLPFVGKLIIFLITIAGTGACLLELFRRSPQK